MATNDDIPELIPNDSGNTGPRDAVDSSDSEGWSDMEEASDLQITCLFCPHVSKTSIAAVAHCDEHINFVQLKARFKMDCYGFIKLVNFIRLHHVAPDFVLNSNHPPPWESEEYLQPVQVDDPWLMIDFDEHSQCESEITPDNKYHVVNAEGGLITLSEQHFSDLQQRIRALTNQVHEKDTAISSLLEDMRQMCVTTQNLVSSDDDAAKIPKEKCVKSVSLHDDEWYFTTYAHVGIHKEMLSDRVRTTSYRDAIVNNTALIQGRTVLDLGCGTGILSMFAATAGAERVIGIDQSDIIYRAMDIVRENNLSDKVNLIKGRLEDTSLPVNKVDVIVSEWMGYFLLYEGMLDSLIYARDHHLVEGGLLLPNRCSLSLVGLADKDLHQEDIGIWSDVYGYRMNCLRQEVLQEPLDIIVDSEKIITKPSILIDLDLHKCTTQNLDFSTDFKLEASRDDSLMALVGYFDVFFDLPSPVAFSTGPHATPTHWKQIVFFLEEPICVKLGDVISGKLTCHRTLSAVRSLNIKIELFGKTYNYYFN